MKLNEQDILEARRYTSGIFLTTPILEGKKEKGATYVFVPKIPDDLRPFYFKAFREIIEEYVSTKRKDAILKALYLFAPLFDPRDDIPENWKKAMEENDPEYLTFQGCSKVLKYVTLLLKSSLPGKREKVVSEDELKRG